MQDIDYTLNRWGYDTDSNTLITIASTTLNMDELNSILGTINMVETDEGYVLMVNGREAGVVSISSQLKLKGVVYNPETKAIEFTFETEDGEQKVSVDVSDLVDVYTAGNGLGVEKNQFFLKIDPSSEKYLSVSENGVKISGIDTIVKSINETLYNFGQETAKAFEQVNKVLTDSINTINGGIDNEIRPAIEKNAEDIKKLQEADVTINSNLVQAVDSLNKNMSDGFNTINGGIDNEIRPVIKENSDNIAAINEKIENAVYFDNIPDGNLPNRKAITLKTPGDIILGTTEDGGTVALLQYNRWGVVDLGTATKPINLNTPAGVRPTVQEAGQTGEEANQIAYLSDIENYNGVSVDEFNAAKEELEGKIELKADKTEIPTKLPNPNALTIKYNGVEAFSYDGSKAEIGNFTVNANTVPGIGENKTIADNINENASAISKEVEDRTNADNDIKKSFDTINLEAQSDLVYALKVGDRIAGTITIPKDQFLKSVSYSAETKTLTFVFVTENGENNVDINIADLIDTYEAGNGLELSENVFSVKIDAETQKYIEVTENGVKLVNLDEAFAKKVDLVDVATEENPNRKAIVLNNHDTLLGKTTDGTAVNVAMVSKWDKVDLGSTQVSINLNGKDERPTYNDEKQLAFIEDVEATNTDLEAKINAEVERSTSEDNAIREELSKKVEYKVFDETRKTIELANHDTISGKKTDGSAVNIAMVSKWDKVDLGSATIELNLNGSKERPTYNDDKELALKEDIDELKKSVEVNIPIRTLRDQVYSKEDILKWFGVSEESELKVLIVSEGQFYSRYGITLSGNPHYYRMPVEYIAFETANQIKMVFVGLDTSNDKPTKYEIIMNLDGTVIEGNSNVKLSTIDLATVEDIESHEPDLSGYATKAEVEAVSAKLDEEATARGEADTNLQNDLQAESTMARAAEKANADAISTLNNSLSEEVANREAADTEIKGMFDTINLEKQSDLVYSLKVGDKVAGTINIPEDQFLKEVEYNAENKTIVFTFNTYSGETNTSVDVSDLVDTYVAGNGLEMAENAFSIKIDPATQKYIEVSENGVKIVGIDEALESLKESYTVNLTNLLTAENSEEIDAAVGGIDNLRNAVKENKVVVGTINNGEVTVSVRNLGNVTTLYYTLDSLAGYTMNEININNATRTLTKDIKSHSVMTEEMVVDNLTTAQSTLPLSANQGKVLNDIVEAKADKTELENLATKAELNKVANSKLYYPGVKVDSKKLFELTKESTEDEIKAALTIKVASGGYTLPTAAILDECLGKGYQLLSNWMPVSVAWNGAAYVFYIVGQSYMMQPTGLYTVALSITADGKYSVFQAAKLEEFANVDDLNEYQKIDVLTYNDDWASAKEKIANGVKTIIDGDGLQWFITQAYEGAISSTNILKVVAARVKSPYVTTDTIQSSYGLAYAQFTLNEGATANSWSRVTSNSEFISEYTINNLIDEKLINVNNAITLLNDKVSMLENKYNMILDENSESIADFVGGDSINDTTKSYSVSNANIESNSTINAKNIVLADSTLSNNARLKVNSNNIEVNNLNISGDFPKENGNSVISLNDAEYVVFKDMTFNSNNVYNGIEIGLNSEKLPKNILFENCKFEGTFSNNAILIFGTQNDATITLSNCSFDKLSNALRLSNKSNASGVTVNIINCSVNQWEETNKEYGGFLICEDYTSDASSVDSNNLFGNGKITVNFMNLTHKGEKVIYSNASRCCGTKDENQVVYVYADNVGFVNYSEDKYPIVSFK